MEFILFFFKKIIIFHGSEVTSKKEILEANHTKSLDVPLLF